MPLIIRFPSPSLSHQVTGSSGCGKSSFINRVRGLTPEDEFVLDESGKEVPNPEYAAVGVTETTMAPHEYPFPGNDKITIWDLPGANTVNFPTSRYSEEMKFADYDAFIILTKDRFTETDKEIASQIKELSKPFFFARTQMDTTLKNEAEDRGKKFNKEETMEKIRVKCREALGDPGQDIYLISKKEKVEVEAGNLKFEIEFRDNRRLKHAVRVKESTFPKTHSFKNRWWTACKGFNEQPLVIIAVTTMCNCSALL